ESFLSRYRYQVMESYIGKELYEARYFRKTFKTYPDILNRLIPTFTDEIDNNQGIFGGALTFGLKNPLRALRLLGAKGMIDNPKDFGDYSYAEDRSHIDKDYQTREIKSNQEFDNRTIFSTADIVFYAHTHYDKENDHIEEFSQEVCYDCIDQFSKVNKDTPCVGDCTAEVHNTIRVDGKRKTHVMALENCVQCTTCEIVCPESNLRVRAALHGFGPDFSGM
ncbi:MAG: ferredoxin family protein, partial [Nitrospinota bacterium]